MTNSQLYEWGWYINPASHGTFIIASNDREVALKHLLETLGVKSLPEYAVLHCWTTDHRTLEVHELQAKNERLRAKLVMAHEALEFYSNVIKFEGCVSEGGIAREALAANAEDVERWKADLQADVIRACIEKVHHVSLGHYHNSDAWDRGYLTACNTAKEYLQELLPKQEGRVGDAIEHN